MWHVPSACAYPLWRMTWASFFGLTLFSFVPSWIREFAWHDCQTGLFGFHSSLSFLFFFLSLGFYSLFASILLCFYLLLCMWACLLLFLAMLAHQALFLSFFSLWAFMAQLFLFCFAFTSSSSFLLAIWAFCCWACFIKNGYQQTSRKIPLLKSKFYILNISMVLITNSDSTYKCNSTLLLTSQTILYRILHMTYICDSKKNLLKIDSLTKAMIALWRQPRSVLWQ